MLKTFIITIVSVLVSLYVFSLVHTGGNLGADIGALVYSKARNSKVAVATTATVVLPANTAREYLSISNDGAGVVYLNFSTTTDSAIGKGIRLGIGEKYEMDSRWKNTYTGVINAIASGTPSSLSILEAF